MVATLVGVPVVPPGLENKPIVRWGRTLELLKVSLLAKTGCGVGLYKSPHG